MIIKHEFYGLVTGRTNRWQQRSQLSFSHLRLVALYEIVKDAIIAALYFCWSIRKKREEMLA